MKKKSTIIKDSKLKKKAPISYKPAINKPNKV